MRRTALPAWWREWAAPLWIGCNFRAWRRLLVKNRFAVHWTRWHFAVFYTLLSLVHSYLGFWQQLLLGRRVANTPLAEAPVFVLGHWRTGTTLLHELLVLDPRHTGPTSYECLVPHHFLLTEWVARWIGFLVSDHRAMDNMELSFGHPQEDEFIWCMQGLPSPYLTMAFPNRPPQDGAYLDLENLTPDELARWKQTLHRFVQQVHYRRRKRVILKNPPHSCRIKILADMYPQARFVHIVRDPYAVYPSTVHLWQALYRTHGLQRPDFAGLEEYVLSTFTHLYRKLAEGRALVDPARFYEMRYEDLVADPEAELRRLYAHLGLGEFEECAPHLRRYLADHAGYETNRYELSADDRATVTRRWGDVIDHYGYARDGSIDTDRIDDVEPGGTQRGRHGSEQADHQRAEPDDDHRQLRPVDDVDAQDTRHRDRDEVLRAGAD